MGVLDRLIMSVFGKGFGEVNKKFENVCVHSGEMWEPGQNYFNYEKFLSLEYCSDPPISEEFGVFFLQK